MDYDTSMVVNNGAAQIESATFSLDGSVYRSIGSTGNVYGPVGFRYAPRPTGNLLKNPGFANCTGGSASYDCRNWILGASAGSLTFRDGVAAPRYSHDPDPNSSAIQFWNNYNAYSASVYQPLEATGASPGTYTLRGWLHSSGGQKELQVRFRDCDAKNHDSRTWNACKGDCAGVNNAYDDIHRLTTALTPAGATYPGAWAELRNADGSSITTAVNTPGTCEVHFYSVAEGANGTVGVWADIDDLSFTKN